MNIQHYFKSGEDLEKAEEPYKSIAIIIDRLYLKAPEGTQPLSRDDFSTVHALSCIRHIAEGLAGHPVSYVLCLQQYWTDLKPNADKSFSRYDYYGAPKDSYRGVIFGGVYYALAHQNFDTELLDLFVEFMTPMKDALPFFNHFKEAVSNIAPKIPAAERGFLTAHQACLLAEILAKTLKIDYKNKKSLAPLASQLSGLSKTTLEKGFSEGYNKATRSKVKELFREMSKEAEDEFSEVTLPT